MKVSGDENPMYVYKARMEIHCTISTTWHVQANVNTPEKLPKQSKQYVVAMK
jgi:hypothetical protein